MGIISYLKSGTNRKHLKRLNVIVDKIEALEPKFKGMSDEELKGMTDIFRKRFQEGETLDDLLPEAFAVVREASTRVLEMRHFRVQLMGGVVLHQGRIAEMRTGEGKTLVSTLPAYLNAISGAGVHIVTVNDYLAKRDAEWMGKVHRFLGLTVGISIAGMDSEQKRAAYACDITYATNNELGFDYLRDNMVVYQKDVVQRPLSYAIIDEVDSILIDEARTPLIISSRSGKSSEMYSVANRFVKTLHPSTNVDDEGKPIDDEESNGDFEVDLKKKAINLTERGTTKAERFFNVEDLTDVEHSELNHFINNALKAVYVMKREDNYIVKEGEVIIIDEFTGRPMVGRRYSDGLHQAIEAKENVKIQYENRTRATITFQNYFRLYKKLAGMTGTAKTEETEFKGIYGLDVVEIPPNKPSQRVDEVDVVYKTIKGKYAAILEDIKECYETGQPVLVGTTTIDKSEEISKMLKMHKIPHNVLNAKYHDKEAEIIAQAGKKGQVTIATNMAGRGTDIMLGGNPEYLALQRMRNQGVSEEAMYYATSYFNTDDADIISAREQFKTYLEEYKKVLEKEKQDVKAVGGLRIIGTERHESRRIDNQLRGRAGRQGDEGSSKFYLSMEDDLLRLFGDERMKNIAEFFKLEEDQPLEFKMMAGMIERAQRNLEGQNYRARKTVLEYDDVMNQQRKVIYEQRNKVLRGESVHEEVDAMIKYRCKMIVEDNTDPKVGWEEWNIHGLNTDFFHRMIPIENYFTEEILKAHNDVDELSDWAYNEVISFYNKKIRDAAAIGCDFEEVERIVMLKVVDNKWTDHIDIMDTLRKEIGLKAYGQQDPVLAYKKEGFELFDDMINAIQTDTVGLLLRVNIEKAPTQREDTSKDINVPNAPKTVVNASKVGRNDPCPCGSGLKYKKCCGKDS